MTQFAMLQVPLRRSRPAPGDQIIGQAEVTLDRRPGMMHLTRKGLYLVLDGDEDGQSWGVDLNELARLMADAINPASKQEATR